MERLTNKAWRNFDPWECCGQDKYCQRGCHDPGGCTKGCIVPQLYARLGAYEDTGLTPGEVKSMQEEHFSGLEMAKLHSALMELKKYQEADRAGRLVVLPCKVGGEVYSTLDDLGRLHQCRATYVLLNEKPYLNTVVLEPVDYEGSQYGASFGAFGQTVFLTPRGGGESIGGDAK